MKKRLVLNLYTEKYFHQFSVDNNGHYHASLKKETLAKQVRTSHKKRHAYHSPYSILIGYKNQNVLTGVTIIDTVVV